ncbi:MAG: phosphoglycolate phosphatase [Henriciella sp.]|jgi:hypothetical protein|nr:hypothetical protein [Henriciella sp.]
MAKYETESAARAILQRIQAYWAERGYTVQGQVYASGYSERLRSTVYEVRTDLVNGMPTTPRQALAKAA